MALSSENREKLNAVIGRMKANNESEDDIRNAVSQFKAKYDTDIVSSEPAIGLPHVKSKMSDYYTKDIPSAFSGVVERTKERAQRISAPTVIGGKLQEMTGTDESAIGPYVEGLGGAPERFARSFAGAVGTIEEPVGVGVELALKSLNRFTGGKFGEIAKKAAAGVLNNDTVKSVTKTVSDWWGGLSEAERANYGTLPDLLDGLGLRADIPTAQIKKSAKQTVSLANKSIPLPKGGDAIQRVSGSLPGGRLAKEKYTRGVLDAVMDEAQNIRGTGATFEETAEQAAKATTSALKKQEDLFNVAYKKISEAGKHGVKYGGASGKGGMWPDEWAASLRRGVNQNAKVFDNVGSLAELSDVPSGISPSVKEAMKSFVDDIENLSKVSDAKRYDVFRDVKSSFGNMAFGPSSKNLSGVEKKAMRDLYRKSVDLERNFIASQVAFDSKEAEKILDLFDATNAYYGKTKPLRDYTKKIVGYGESVGEKGYQNSEAALRKLISPQNSDELQKIMALLDEDARQHLKDGLLIKFIDDALIENKQFISASKLEKNLDAYGRKSLANVVGADKVSQIENLIDAMKKTKANTLKFADRTNPSGTAASMLEKIFYFGTTVGGIVSPKAAAAAAGGAYLNRLVGHIIFNQPLTGIEQAIGRAPGSIAKYGIAAQGLAPSSITRGTSAAFELDKYSPLKKYSESR